MPQNESHSGRWHHIPVATLLVEPLYATRQTLTGVVRAIVRRTSLAMDQNVDQPSSAWAATDVVAVVVVVAVVELLVVVVDEVEVPE